MPCKKGFRFQKNQQREALFKLDCKEREGKWLLFKIGGLEIENLWDAPLVRSGANRQRTAAAKTGSLIFVQDFLYPAHLPGVQLYFDAVRVLGRFGEDGLHQPSGQLAAALVLFLDNFYQHARLDVISEISFIHGANVGM